MVVDERTTAVCTKDPMPAEFKLPLDRAPVVTRDHSFSCGYVTYAKAACISASGQTRNWCAVQVADVRSTMFMARVLSRTIQGGFWY